MAVTHKIAPAQQPLPLGWNYSYLNDGFTGPNGEFISRDMVQIHGSFHKAFAHMYGATGATGAAGVPTGGIGANGAAGPYSMASGFQPAATITMQGKLGNVTINLDTGELTMPPNVGRDAAIRDFWLGFQEHFQPTNKTKYENTIRDLQLELKKVEDSAKLLRQADTNAAKKIVAEKVAKKYAGEKFIMVKPEDLVKFIQDA